MKSFLIFRNLPHANRNNIELICTHENPLHAWDDTHKNPHSKKMQSLSDPQYHPRIHNLNSFNIICDIERGNTSKTS